MASGIFISCVLISRTRFRQNCDPTAKSTCNGMNGLATIGEREAGTPLPRLYLRPDEAARAIGVSKRTLSAWQPPSAGSPEPLHRTALFHNRPPEARSHCRNILPPKTSATDSQPDGLQSFVAIYRLNFSGFRQTRANAQRAENPRVYWFCLLQRA